VLHETVAQVLHATVARVCCMQGFGFVTYASSQCAEAARIAMHGAVVEGRKIEVYKQPSL